MDEETKKCLREVLDYFIDDERRHYEESDKPNKHIFTSLKRVEEWLIANE